MILMINIFEYPKIHQTLDKSHKREMMSQEKIRPTSMTAGKRDKEDIHFSYGIEEEIRRAFCGSPAK